VSCTSSAFLIQQIISALLALALFVLSGLFAAIYYESNGLSKFPDARAHGRADILMLLVQGALVLVGQTFYDVISTWVIIATAAFAGFLWLGAYFVYMPYYQHYMNAANMAGAAVFLWSVLCLTLNNYYPNGDAAVMLYCGGPIAALAGVSLCNYRATTITLTPASRLANAFEVELKGRYMLHEAIWGHPLYTSGDAAVFTGSHKSGLTSTGGKKSEGDAEPVDTDLSDDVEDAAVQLRKLIPSEVLASVQQLYQLSSSRFRASGFLHVFCARFYATYLGNRHMQFSHLLQAEKRMPPADVSYLVFQARKLAEDTTGGGAGMSAMNRVTFEKYAADARKYVMLSAQKQLAFWAELLEAQPDLSRLHRLSTEINDGVVAAEKCFSELYAINPQSLAVIRLYAAFNAHVTMNLDKSVALAAEADRLDDLKTKDHSLEGATRLEFMAESSLDIMAENTAIITLGASARNLGLISAANASACKLFGYARLQLERRSAFTLIPPLLDSYHEKSFRKYVSTGEGAIVDYTRISFGLHKSGAIVPILSSIRDAPSDGGPPSFIWLMREMRTQSQYLMIDDTNTVIGATAGASAMLGVDSTAIATREIRIPDYIAEWTVPHVQHEMQTQDSVIKIEARVPVVEKVEEDGAGSVKSDKAASEDGSRDEIEGIASAATPPVRQALSTVKPRAASPIAAQMSTKFGATSPVPAQMEIQETWVRAHLQHIQQEELSFWVLHLQRLTTTDSTTVQRMEQRRSHLLAGGDDIPMRTTVMQLTGVDPASARRNSGMGASGLRMQQPSPDAPTNIRRPSVNRRPSVPGPAEYQFAALGDSLPPRHAEPLQQPMSPSTSTALTAAPQKPKMKRDGYKKSTRHLTDQTPVRPTTSEGEDLLGMLQLPGSVDVSNSLARAFNQESSTRRIEDVPPIEHNTQLETAGRMQSDTSSVPLTEDAAAKRPVLLQLAHDAAQAGDGSHTGSFALKNSILKHPSVSNKSKDHDGAESRSSGGSRATSITKSMVRLRRLLTEGTRGLLPGLWWLRVVGIAITLLAIVLATAVAIIARQSFLDYMDNLNYVRMGAERLHLKADMIYSVQVRHQTY
jgi:PAS domain S-box-containing protein